MTALTRSRLRTASARSRLRTASAALAVGAAAMVAADLVIPAHAESLSLWRAAAASGRQVGVAVSASRLSDSTYTGIVDREFASITPENEFTFEATESTRNSPYFTATDTLVAWAQAHGKAVRGWGLLFGIQRPMWLMNLTPAEQRQAAMHHITTVVDRYRGKVAAWDVVTEEITETGELRNDLMNRTGSGWMEEAFATAHAADPDARLCYTDYGMEEWTSPKTQKVFQMLKDMRNRGVPVNCVGIEGHFTGGISYPTSLRTTMPQFSLLGMDVQLTQLDVRGDSAQPSVYAQVAADCLAVIRCSSITVWAVRDSDSWRSSESPVLFDRTGAPKPAYYAFRDAFGQTTTTGPTTTSQPPTTKTTKTTKTSKTKSPKPTRTLCRTRKKDGSTTCKTVTPR